MQQSDTRYVPSNQRTEEEHPGIPTAGLSPVPGGRSIATSRPCGEAEEEGGSYLREGKFYKESDYFLNGLIKMLDQTKLSILLDVEITKVSLSVGRSAEERQSQCRQSNHITLLGTSQVRITLSSLLPHEQWA